MPINEKDTEARVSLYHLGIDIVMETTADH